MSKLRIAAGLVLLALVFGACTPTSSGDLDIQTDCTSVTTARSTAPSGVVMTVRADGCPPTDRADDVAAAAWHALRGPVHEMRIELSGRDEHQPTTMSVYSPATLAARYGPGPSGPVTTPAQNDDSYLWLLLPLAWLISTAGAIALARRTARSGVIFFLLR